MEIEVHDSLQRIDCVAWNKLNPAGNPFLRYEFLVALENNDCLGQRHGWYPRYFVLYDDKQQLIAAVPAYIKTNSYGEFVFDWAWADAYHKHGLRYYPKMVVSSPYTPVTGTRLLISSEVDYLETARALHHTVQEYCKDQGLSSLHWLFTLPHETDLLESDGLLRRLGCQYHWHNDNYTHFDDFLQQLRAKKRKQIKRERRHPHEQGIELSIQHGNQLSDAEIVRAHHYYASTFDKKSGEASLTCTFFQEIARTMGESMLVVFAHIDKHPIACAIMFRSADTLYGRYWGCDQDYNSLHFETCFYQGIDYCINNGLQHFEPGAQGEHKIWRGFIPTKTWSAHWIADPQFRDAISRYLVQETEMMEAQCQHLMQYVPFHREHIG